MIAYPDPPLAAGGVALRRWESDDLPLVRSACRDAELVSGTTLPVPFTTEDGLAFIDRQWRRAETGEGISLAIEDRLARSAVGCTTLILRRPGVGDLGYWLIREARGRGIGRATVEILVPWVFRQMDVEAIEAFVRPDNVGSRRILDRCGFTPIGSRRHRVGRVDEELLVYRRGT